MNLCGVKSLFYDVQHLTSTAFVSVCTAFVSVISHNGIDIDYDHDRDPVHYGVIYAYVYANDVAQLLFYNIQGFDPYDNNKCNSMNCYNGDYNDVVCNNSPQDINVDCTVRI